MTSTATIIGNVTRDPEIKFAASGKAHLRIGVAVGARLLTAGGVWTDGPTSFFDVVCFGNLAENVAASVTKGTRVVAVGRLQQRSYETKEGEKRNVVELIADEIGVSLVPTTVDIHRVSRDLTQQAPEEPF